MKTDPAEHHEYSHEVAATLPEGSADAVGGECLCVRCGYNLRGLAADGLCPECSTPVERSVRGDLLRYAAPEYVNRLRLGAIFTEAAVYVLLGGFAVVIVGGFAGYALGVRSVRSAGAAVVAPLLGFAVATVIGWSLLTTSSPAETGASDLRRARRAVRSALAAAVGLALLSEGLSFAFPGVAASVPGFGTAVTMASLLGGALAFAALMHYVRRLSARIPSPEIDAAARRTALIGLVVLTAQLINSAGVFPPRGATVPLELLVRVAELAVKLVAGLGMLFFLVDYAGFAHGLRVALGSVWREASGPARA